MERNVVITLQDRWGKQQQFIVPQSQVNTTITRMWKERQLTPVPSGSRTFTTPQIEQAVQEQRPASEVTAMITTKEAQRQDVREQQVQAGVIQGESSQKSIEEPKPEVVTIDVDGKVIGVSSGVAQKIQEEAKKPTTFTSTTTTATTTVPKQETITVTTPAQTITRTTGKKIEAGRPQTIDMTGKAVVTSQPTTTTIKAIEDYQKKKKSINIIAGNVPQVYAGQETIGFSTKQGTIYLKEDYLKNLEKEPQTLLHHEVLHELFPEKSEYSIRQMEDITLKTLPNIGKKDTVYVAPKGSEVKGVIKGVPASKGFYEKYMEAVKTPTISPLSGQASLGGLGLDNLLPSRKPSIPTTTQTTSVINKPITTSSISKNLEDNLKKTTVSTSTVKTTTEPFVDVFANKELEKMRYEEAEKIYGKMSIPQKVTAHYQTLFSEKGFEYLGAIVSPTPVKQRVIENLAQIGMEKTGKETNLELFGKGVGHAIKSPPILIGASYLTATGLGLGATAVGSTKIGSAVLSSSVAKAGLVGVSAFGVGATGVNIYQDIQAGDIDKAIGKGITFGASIYAGAKGYKAGEELYDVWRTRGLTKLESKDLIPEDVLSGKTTFPEAGTARMSMEERARIHLEKFQKESIRLPEQTKPLAYHATPEEWSELISTEGTSYLPGTYGSYGVSPHFAGISKEPQFKLFGIPQVGAKPTIYAFEPTGMKINIPTSKGSELIFSQPTQKGVLDIPGMKTEVEGIFPPGTEFTPTGEKFWIPIYGRRVPIIKASAIAGGVTQPGAYASIPSVGLSESLGISPYTYLISPQSLATASLSFLPSSKISIPSIKSTGLMTSVYAQPVSEPKIKMVSIGKPTSPSTYKAPKVTMKVPSSYKPPSYPTYKPSPSAPSMSLPSESYTMKSIASSVFMPSTPSSVSMSISSLISMPSSKISPPSPQKYKPSSIKIPSSTRIIPSIKVPPSYPTYKPQSSPYKPTSYPPYKPYKSPPSYPTYKEPPISPPPYKPIKFPKSSQMGRPSVQGFDVYVRKMGKWMKATGQPLFKTEAMKLGGHIAESTPRASFRLIPSKLAPVPTRLPYAFRSERFRAPVRRGVKSSEQVFIEKSKFRIDMPGELKGITYKGWEAMRTGKSKSKKKRPKMWGF